jgi:hypothetical protein
METILVGSASSAEEKIWRAAQLSIHSPPTEVLNIMNNNG